MFTVYTTPVRSSQEILFSNQVAQQTCGFLNEVVYKSPSQGTVAIPGILH